MCGLFERPSRVVWWELVAGGMVYESSCERGLLLYGGSETSARTSEM